MAMYPLTWRVTSRVEHTDDGDEVWVDITGDEDEDVISLSEHEAWLLVRDISQAAVKGRSELRNLLQKIHVAELLAQEKRRVASRSGE